MRPYSFLTYLMAASLILALVGLPPAWPVQAAGGSNQFGYNISLFTVVMPPNPADNNAWIEINTSGTAILTNSDNDSTGAIPLGFDFKYYENTYTQVYLNANGIVSLNPIANGNNVNTTIPLDEQPNALIAAFWDDLAVGGEYNSGAVYYQRIGAYPDRKFVIEWDGVTRLGGTETLTFEVVLYEGSGIIDIKYKTVSGVINQSTIGIEDSDGVEGIQIACNGTAINGFTLQSLAGIRFNFPGASYRLKALPPFKSGFLRNRTLTLPVTVKNTSDPSYPADIYNVTASRVGGATDWTVTLLDQNGAALTDSSDPDSTPDTGQVPSGESRTVQVRMTAPGSAAIGDYLLLNLTFTSAGAPTKSYTVSLQGAISAPLLQVYSSLTGGALLRATNATLGFNKPVSSQPDYYYSLATVPMLKKYHYFTTWVVGSGAHYDLRYSTINLVSAASPTVFTLVENADNTFDQSARATVAPNGTVGIVFTRSINQLNSTNQNMYFARIAQNGTLLGSPVNITNNSNSGTTSDQGIPFFSNGNIIATQDGNFVITWVKSELYPDAAIHQDIGRAAYNASSGAEVTAPGYLTSATASVSYTNPSLVLLNSGNQSFLVYLRNESTNPTNPITLRGQLLNSSGGKVGGEMNLGAAKADKLDAVQLTGGNVLSAWIDQDTLQAGYGVWTTGGSTVQAPAALNSPDSHGVDQVAVTYDEYGHGIVTWSNRQNDRLYYALLNGSGGVITPPMIQLTSQGIGEKIHLGSGTSSAAFLEDPIEFTAYLPFGRR